MQRGNTSIKGIPKVLLYTGTYEREKTDWVLFVGLYAIDHEYIKQSRLTPFLGFAKSNILRSFLPSQTTLIRTSLHWSSPRTISTATTIYIYIYHNIFLSLSLSLYIYIYVYI